MASSLRVGIIGANADRGWARESHVPAVQKLAGLELAAVANRGQDRADAAAKAFGVEKAYGNAADLFGDPDVDLVTVAVTLPAHRDLILGALAAGKHIYCEYPLGRDVSESQALAMAAHQAGVHTAIGLQTRMNPAVHHGRGHHCSRSTGAPRGASSQAAFAFRSMAVRSRWTRVKVARCRTRQPMSRDSKPPCATTSPTGPRPSPACIMRFAWHGWSTTSRRQHGREVETPPQTGLLHE